MENIMFSFKKFLTINNILMVVGAALIGYGSYSVGIRQEAESHQLELAQQRVRANESSAAISQSGDRVMKRKLAAADAETTLFYKESDKYARLLDKERDLSAAITALAARAAEGDNSDTQVALFRVEMALHALGRDGDVSAFKRLRERLNDRPLLKDRLENLQQEVLEAIGDRVFIKTEDLK